MKAIAKSASAVLLLLVAIVVTAQAQQYPKSTGYVSDFAGLLSPNEGSALNQELAAFEKKTTIEIAVVTVGSLNGESIESYTRGLATSWGVGKRDQNNGIVFLIAPKDHKMRIETASGIRSKLTDGHADEIRDDVVLPLFKAGNMPKGVIDGTHAIMSALDASPSAQAEAIPSSKPKDPNWTPEKTRGTWEALGLFAVVIILFFLIVQVIFRSTDRRYVLENKGRLSEKLMGAKKLAANPDWAQAHKKVDSLDFRLGTISSTMSGEITFAEKARKEGPELMNKIPGMIKAVEQKIAEGKPSPDAVKYLDAARSQYAQAQSRQSGMSVTDWVLLYAILNSAQSNTASAVSSHDYANTTPSPNSSNSDNSGDPNESDDSGGSFSFGGGGGFDGGGSSGSW